MYFDQIIPAPDIHIVALIPAAAMLAAWEVGRIGGHLQNKESIKPSTFDDVSMALLGLLVGF